MAYQIDALTNDCYPETTVLINKFDIQNQEKLTEVENVIVAIRNAQWIESPQMRAFDFEHYKCIHHFFFSELYDWAGEIRCVDLSKKGTQFTPSNQIESQAKVIFNRLGKLNYFKGLRHEKFLDELVDFYCITNLLHPFREGNGRTQRAFLAQLVAESGYTIDWSKVDGDLLMIATIQAANGVTDLLRDVLNESLL